MSAYVDAALHASVGSQPVSTAVSNLSQKNEQMILRLSLRLACTWLSSLLVRCSRTPMCSISRAKHAYHEAYWISVLILMRHPASAHATGIFAKLPPDRNFKFANHALTGATT